MMERSTRGSGFKPKYALEIESEGKLKAEEAEYEEEEEVSTLHVHDVNVFKNLQLLILKGNKS